MCPDVRAATDCNFRLVPLYLGGQLHFGPLVTHEELEALSSDDHARGSVLHMRASRVHEAAAGGAAAAGSVSPSA